MTTRQQLNPNFFPTLFQEIVAGFVIFEPNEEPATTSSSSVSQSSSNQNHGGTSADDDQDLEGQIMALDERWIVLCTWNEKRKTKLREVIHLWKPFEDERLRLSRWIDTAEEAFRVMERSPTEETNELLVQATEITVGRKRSTNPFFSFNIYLFFLEL